MVSRVFSKGPSEYAKGKAYKEFQHVGVRLGRQIKTPIRHVLRGKEQCFYLKSRAPFKDVGLFRQDDEPVSTLN